MNSIKYRHKSGAFEDETDYVEVFEDGEVQIVDNKGYCHYVHAWIAKDFLDSIANGTWVEVE